MSMVHSPSAHTQSATDPLDVTSADYGWKPGGRHVLAALRGLTRAERRHVEAGYVGEATSATIRSLQCKAMFFLFIDSPNGRCGFLKLTPLGENVRKTIKARTANSVGTEAEGRSAPIPPVKTGEG